jgi:hypothetical protein
MHETHRENLAIVGKSQHPGLADPGCPGTAVRMPRVEFIPRIADEAASALPPGRVKALPVFVDGIVYRRPVHSDAEELEEVQSRARCLVLSIAQCYSKNQQSAFRLQNHSAGRTKERISIAYL